MLDYIVYFFVYSFIGWVIEVAFHGAKFSQWVNRGFLNGAICPIYGLGMVLLIEFLGSYENNPVVLFFGSMILCSGLELATGLVLEKIFKLKWWDYSKEKWNFKGHICLKFSILWGIGGTVAIGLIHRVVSKVIDYIPLNLILILILLMTILLVVDIMATVIDLVGFNKELTSLDEMGNMIRILSDDLTNIVYDETMEAKGSYEKHKEELVQKRQELDQLKERFEIKVANIAGKISKRKKVLLGTLSDVKMLHHKESFEHVKNMIKQINKDKDNNKDKE